ncbi:MAG TPA: phospholipase D-like domain-containing protein [Kribbella sp.]|nr:phospholipase D-like domain-containing protein [Kribbella sp.]
MSDQAADRWFLTPAERGNVATGINRLGEGSSWVEGNLVRPLVDGATYFRRLYRELCALRAGDRVFFTDWRGDADERLLPDGPTIGEVLGDLARSGVEVRGLLWRSYSDHLRFNAQENQRLGAELNSAGGEVLLDQRLRRFASHHQKLFVVRHRGEPERDAAFVGGLDLCHGRRDDTDHNGDPQQPPMDPRYGDRTPWHDVALELRGPVVGDLVRTFAERWDDPHPLDRRTPYRMIVQRRARMPRHPEPLTEAFPDPPRVGPHAVQVLRTYGHKRPAYPFAPEGERSVARAYAKAFAQARSLIYVEDQYLWSKLVAREICEALERSAELRVIVVVPRYPDADGAVSGPPSRIGQLHAMRLLQRTAPDRVGIYDLENSAGVPIYVHAKICVVDDVWFTCGSDNFNRRSWTNDSELTCAVIDSTLDGREPRDLSGQGDGARRAARDLRLEVWKEHLELPADHPSLLDPAVAFELWRRTADDLDAWHAEGQPGERPPGRVRRHEPEPVTRLQALWAEPMYRLIYDPDGRPRSLRRRGRL